MATPEPKRTAPAALLDWDSMFMGVALLAAARSKDHRARNGACIVSPDQRIIGVGYNGLPRGCDDQDPVFWSDDDSDPYHSRHSYVVHAEINATLNCVVLPLTNARIYTTQFPCPRCTQAIIQAGITSVVYLREKPHHERANLAARRMFEASRVDCRHMDEVNAKAFAWTSGLENFLGPLQGHSEEDV
ncbi:deoxycytidylate deaminase [Ramlibacter sp.]|uniref:deoxycytidylate deaminase n=1 Tax=Ramlibacter sp. TaxID=1917967 RepID=UPI003D09D76F